jgi:hypothetical protein
VVEGYKRSSNECVLDVLIDACEKAAETGRAYRLVQRACEPWAKFPTTSDLGVPMHHDIVGSLGGGFCLQCVAWGASMLLTQPEPPARPAAA